MLSRLLALLRIDPSMKTKFDKLLNDQLSFELNNDSPSADPIICFMTIDQLVRSHTEMSLLDSLESMMNSLTKAFLFCEGINPYGPSKDVFEHVPYELDETIAFLESILRKYRRRYENETYNLDWRGEELEDALWFVPPDKLIFLWNAINSFKSLKEYIGLIVRLGILNREKDDKNCEDLKLEQIHF